MGDFSVCMAGLFWPEAAAAAAAVEEEEEEVEGGDIGKEDDG